MKRLDSNPARLCCLGHIKEEELHAIHDAAQAYVEEMMETSEHLPALGVVIVDDPVVTITQCSLTSHTGEIDPFFA